MKLKLNILIDLIIMMKMKKKPIDNVFDSLVSQ